MKLLKTVVIGLGVLIAAAVVLLVYGLYKKSADPAWRPLAGASAPASSAAPQATAPAAPLAAFGDVTLDIPRNCEIVGTYAENGRLIFEIVAIDDCPAAVILDLATGKRLGSVRLR